MRCPFCSNPDTVVKDSRPAEDNQAIRRRRHCPACGGRFTTFERIQLRDLQVTKSDGQRQPFNRDKLTKSIYLATQKRSIELDEIDQMVSRIVRRLESRGDLDVPSKEIGALVMDGLRNLDTVAFVRYASVYRDFQEVVDFSNFIRRHDLDHGKGPG